MGPQGAVAGFGVPWKGLAPGSRRAESQGEQGTSSTPGLSTPERVLPCPSLRAPTSAAGHPSTLQRGRFEPHKGFFSGVFPGWQEQSSNTPWLERGGLWAEQGAQRGFGGAEGHTLGFSRV